MILKQMIGDHVLGLKLLTHSIKQVFGNFRAALQISGVIFAVLCTLTFFVFTRLEGQADLQFSGSFWALAVFAMVLSAAGYLWIAVSWHRFVLLDETPVGLIPRFHRKNIISYFIRLLIILLVLLITGLLMGFVALVLVSAFPSAAFATLLPLLINLGLSAFFFTLSPILVAGALGKKMSFSEAQAAFSGKLIGLLVLIVLIAFLSWLGGFVLGDIWRLGAVVSGVISTIYYWVTMMIGISIYTTLYGHFIEKRELV